MRQAQSYCRGLIWNVLGDDRLEVVPTTDLEYDFTSWIGDPEQGALTDFSWKTKCRVAFVLSDKQYRLVEKEMERFGRHDLGLGKALLRLNHHVLWRSPVLDENVRQSAMSEKIFHPV